ncbi:Hsp70 family protein [Micromonospora sediminimaris]|uniref:Hsp70 family protein n=1 Tax=Micromonospora sediminimaris TaxID=547162 RepID=UPI00379DFC75
MRAGQARLAIDCGSATTTAVLAWPDGSWSPLLFDGEPGLPSAVLVAADGSVVTGQRAWQAATADPQRFVPRPRRPADEQVSVADVQVAPADLVAATLRRVVDEAHRMAGGPVEDVRLVVPAGWGPRRRTWLRQAAHRAGLAQPRLVEAPVAVASDALASGVQLPVGSVVVVCDLGAGVEVSVLRRGPAGFEVLSTLADPDAGGDAIDAALTATLLPDGGVPAADGWALTASLRTAKHALAGHAAVAVPVPSGPAVVLNHLMVEQTARPALVRAAGLVRNAVDAAEADPTTIAALWCVGGTAQMPLVADVMAAETGLRPLLVPDPLVAAARGAADAGGLTTEQAVVGEPVPSVWRAVAIGVPGFASLALVSHALFTPTWHSGLMREWAFMNWGEVAMASVFAVIACLAAGTVLGSSLATRTDSGVPLSPAAQVATGILTSAWLGVAVVGMYAVVGSQYIGTDLGAFLRWTLLPVAPILLVAMVLALIAFRQWRTPRGGWSEFLAFPVSSTLTATVGMVLVQWSLPATYSPGMEVWLGLGSRLGGLLIGVGVITALVSGWWLRLVMGVPFAILTATLVGRYNTGTVAGLYVVAVIVWWLARLWTRILYTAPSQPRRNLVPPGPPRS